MKTNLKYSEIDIVGITESISRNATQLRSEQDLDVLMDCIGDAKYVLLGEASHGTHEYYTWRMRITQRLIREKRFSFIAVEGDWPDCYRVNRYVKGYPHSGKNATEVLTAFNRWPTWMWANWEMVAFSEWLRNFNRNLMAGKRIGFYGLDVYSLWESMEAIITYLRKNDPGALKTALNAMRCFEPYRSDEGQSYARASYIVPELCGKEVVALLREITRKMPRYNSDRENVFSTEQNALVAVNAEKYYRAMIRGGPSSWNIRDDHMVSTLNRLMAFHGNGAKCIVWEHNTHIGDARATDMARDGMMNVGQLVREQHAAMGAVSVGFGSYKGTVIAGREWGDVMRKMHVPPAKKGSWEYILHQASGGNDSLFILDSLKNERALDAYLDHRAIGVVYHPEHEQYGNYVPSILPSRYDAFIFLDETKALHPLHIQPDGHQVPGTFPFGM